MANKLYPPILEASIPAFCGNQVAIPFLHNPLVANVDYSGLTLQMKKINSELIGVFEATSYNNEQHIAYFTLDTNKLGKNPNWYKFQLAYNDKGQIGYYSTVAIGRYLGEEQPTLEISSESAGRYKAVYSHPADLTEKAYSFHFILKDDLDTVIEDLGEKIHDINSDENSNESYEFFEFKYNLNATSRKYSIYCTVRTINGLVLNASCPIDNSIIEGVYLSEDGVEDIFNINTYLNRDNGSVKIEVKMKNRNASIVGRYIIRRICSKDNYLRITPISHFSICVQPDLDVINLETYNIVLLEDLTVEAGYYYRYYIQRYNDYGIYSRSIGTSKYPIFVSFDDCFLYDGERQLCIQYNPKISSFKTNIQQQKIETLGDKYPFIFRNGIIDYKEFPISGLISFNMDQNDLFMSSIDKERLGIVPDHAVRGEDNYNNSTTLRNLEVRRIAKNLQRGTPQNLVDINISAEREFKLMVLDFLNNPKPKLFKSATEGNFCVYTINSTLTPTDSLGRMLHTFNCTAYEIMDVEDFYKQLIIEDGQIYDSEGHLLSVDGLDYYKFYNKTLSYINPKKYKGINLLQYNEFARNFEIRDAIPFSKYRLSFVNLADKSQKIPDQIIMVGSTGSYNYFTTKEYVYIKGFYIQEFEREPYHSDYVTITFKNYIKISYSDFNYLSDYSTNQIIGYQVHSNTDQIYSYIKPSTIHSNGSVDLNYITSLFLLRVQNRNNTSVQTAKYSLSNNYFLNIELEEVKQAQRVAPNKKIEISKDLALYLKNIKDKWHYDIQLYKMSVDERAAYFKAHLEDTRNVSYYLATNINNLVFELDEQWNSIIIPPLTTKVLALNMKEISNIIIDFNADNRDLWYEISCESSSANYNYGG